MSSFRKYLKCAVDSGNASLLYDVERLYLKQDEIQMLDFMLDFLQKHRKIPQIDAITLEGYELPEDAPEPHSYYLERVKRRYMHEQVSTALPDIMQQVSAKEPEKAIAIMRSILDACSGITESERTVSVAVAMHKVLGSFVARKRLTGLAGITTGYLTLDACTGGLMPGDILSVVGRPSVGKSQVILEMLCAAWSVGNSAALITMEMGYEQFARRIMGRMLSINPRAIADGMVDGFGEQRMRDFLEYCKKEMPPLSIVTGDFGKSTDIVDYVLEKDNPAILYIDAAYLLKPKERGRMQSHESFSQVIADVKQSALRYKKPIVLSCQFNRTESLNKKKSKGDGKDGASQGPSLESIGRSDSVGQDSSIVIGITKGDPPNEEITRNITMMKNREGEVVDYKIRFGFAPPNFGELDGTTDAFGNKTESWY